MKPKPWKATMWCVKLGLHYPVPSLKSRYCKLLPMKHISAVGRTVSAPPKISPIALPALVTLMGPMHHPKITCSGSGSAIACLSCAACSHTNVTAMIFNNTMHCFSMLPRSLVGCHESCSPGRSCKASGSVHGGIM